MTLFDKWSKDPGAAGAVAYATQQGDQSARWQAVFARGGMATPPGNRLAATLTQASTPRRPDAATLHLRSTTSPPG